jgi:copper chaperone
MARVPLGGTPNHRRAKGTLHLMGMTSEIVSTFGVSGMTCSHCVAAVTEEVGRLEGAGSVSVVLVPGGVSRVTVASAGALDRDAVAAAIDEAGYQLEPEPR